MYRKTSIDAPLEPSSQKHLRMVSGRTDQGLGCRWVRSSTATHLAAAREREGAEAVSL